MNSETPIFEPTSVQQPKRKRLVLAGLAGLLLVLLAIILVLVSSGHKTQKQSDNPQPVVPKALQSTFGAAAFRYTGTPQYDACGLLTINTLKTKVKDYQTILAHLGGSKIEASPLTLEHTYLDRDIAQALGPDDQARATGNTARPNAFGSLFDSNCVYGQGGEVGKRLEFARVYVTQKPTPLSQDFLQYLASIDHIKQAAGAFDIYQIAPGGGDTFYSVIVVKQDKSLAVLLRAATKDLALAGANEIGTKLESSPKGPVNIAYPAPYAQLINPCNLLSAADFQQFTGKPASALAQETLYLNDLNAFTVPEVLHPLVSTVRQCRRLEIDRSIADNIAETTVTLRQFRNQASAKKYVTNLKADNADGLTIVPAKNQVGDEAYIKSADSPNPALPKYIFEMRLGASIITLDVEGDNLRSDATPGAFETRLLPAARLILENYKQLTK